MAVSYTATVGTTDYGFDWVDQEIEVEDGVTEVVAADLKQSIREAEASEQGIVFNQIANTFNPVVLTSTASTFLNVVLLETWKILSLSTSGTFEVGNGNVVSDNDGIAIFAPNILVSKVNNTSQAGVLVQSVDIETIRKIIQNEQYTNPITNKMEIQNDAGTAIEFEADVWEDDGVTPWDGTGPIVRRDRLE